MTISNTTSAAALRIVFMGTGPFAVPSLEAMLSDEVRAKGHEVVALVTQPARTARGNRAPPPSPMRAVAESRGTPILDPESINTDESRTQLRELRPDLFIVADYGQILSNATLDTARLGGINLHGSLLPKYRGAAPINWAIFHGDAETGVTVIQMSSKVDAGACLMQAKLAIDPEENAVELEHRLAALGAPLVVEIVERLAVGAVQPLVQDSALATPARRLRKTDGEVDWSRTALQIKNQIRALEPWPRTATHWLRAGVEPLRVILCRAAIRESTSAAGDAAATQGVVTEVSKEEFVIATGEGLLVVQELQPAGKRSMPAGEFLRGYQVKVGEKFGPAPAIS
ncbi:MAG: methionyl-tRNA formyltransferase [Planctomycetia bacterium]|nr:methionyl-tRNA formyltransferase [Planctomycetia bacterium]